MIPLETAPYELRTQHLKECLTFLDQQRLIQPSVNEQLQFDFQGLRRSYLNNPSHPDSKILAHFGRIWIYDLALNIYADLKAGRIRLAAYQVKRALQLALQERERGFKGLWHFSYNTLCDSFIDPRGPAGAVCWCLNAFYAFALVTGDALLVKWTNSAVREFLFSQQVMDLYDPRYGLVRAGLFNPEEMVDESRMGYKVYEGLANKQYQHVILEHNADAAATFRLAFRATKRCAPQERDFQAELIYRHNLLMQAVRHRFWQKDHFVSAMDPEGRFYTGTDGSPSVAVDNNTWAAHVFLPYDPSLVAQSIKYVEDRFLIEVPMGWVEDAPQGTASRLRFKGLYYFPASFQDPFVQVPPQYRTKMEQLLQPEATFGFLFLLKDAADSMTGTPLRIRLESRAEELYESMVSLLGLYGPFGAPYASANVPATFTTLHSVTTAATAAIAAAILQGAPSDDFIGVTPPPEFLVDGQPPLQSL